MSANTQLWVQWLKRDVNFEQAFLDDLAEIERVETVNALDGEETDAGKMFVARGVRKAIRQLRHKLTMYEKEAQSNARRTNTR